LIDILAAGLEVTIFCGRAFMTKATAAHEQAGHKELGIGIKYAHLPKDARIAKYAPCSKCGSRTKNALLQEGG